MYTGCACVDGDASFNEVESAAIRLLVNGVNDFRITGSLQLFYHMPDAAILSHHGSQMPEAIEVWTWARPVFAIVPSCWSQWSLRAQATPSSF